MDKNKYIINGVPCATLGFFNDTIDNINYLENKNQFVNQVVSANNNIALFNAEKAYGIYIIEFAAYNSSTSAYLGNMIYSVAVRSDGVINVEQIARTASGMSIVRFEGNTSQCRVQNTNTYDVRIVGNIRKS